MESSRGWGYSQWGACSWKQISWRFVGYVERRVGGAGCSGDRVMVLSNITLSLIESSTTFEGVWPTWCRDNKNPIARILGTKGNERRVGRCYQYDLVQTENLILLADAFVGRVAANLYVKMCQT
eukprot:746676-Hanusia_phi.AAC.11